LEISTKVPNPSRIKTNKSYQYIQNAQKHKDQFLDHQNLQYADI